MKKMCFINVSNHEKSLPYYLYGAATDYEQEEVLRPYGCNWYQLNICIKGEAILILKGVETPVKGGQSIIIHPETPYTYRPVGKGLIVSWIAFDGFQVNSMLKSIGVFNSGVYSFNNHNQIYEYIKEILTIQNLNVTEQGFKGSSYVYNFLLLLLKNKKTYDSSSKDMSIEKIRISIDFMQNHLQEQIGIDEIAGSMGITPQHYCLLFKQIMNQRPFEYFNSLRLNNAKNILINSPNLSIKEVAKLSGYQNINYFIQLFKKNERLTPTKFRELYRSSNET